MTTQEAIVKLDHAELYLAFGHQDHTADRLIGDAKRILFAQWELDRATEMQAHLLISIKAVRALATS